MTDAKPAAQAAPPLPTTEQIQFFLDAVANAPLNVTPLQTAGAIMPVLETLARVHRGELVFARPAPAEKPAEKKPDKIEKTAAKIVAKASKDGKLP